MTKMGAIHLIRKDDNSLPQITAVAPRSDLYRSGNWVVSESTSASLVGSKIYFHRAKSKPSFYGGTITAFERISEGPDAGRIIFTFQFADACRGVKTPGEGWAQEKKIVD